MTSHRQIMTNLGTDICASESVKNLCISSFGRGLEVVISSYAQGIPEEEEAPFLWIHAQNENELVAADETFTVRCVLGCVVENSDGERMICNRVTERTNESNGLVIAGANKTVEDLRDAIIAVVRDSRPGAIIDKIRVTENDLSHFPLEWAEFEVDFTEPEAL